MPVIGHAVVGTLTSLLLPPPRQDDPRAWLPRAWPAVLVGLAYAPDICAYALTLPGGFDAEHAKALTHSAPAALALSLLAVLAGSRVLPPGTGSRTFVVAALLVWSHDVADLIQGSVFSAGWPLPGAGRFVHGVLPDTLLAETVVFCGGGALVGAALLGPGPGRSGRRHRAAYSLAAGAPGWAAVLTVAGTAVLIDTARTTLDADLDRAARSVTAREYRQALETLDRAERWRWFGRRARLEYLRGVSHAGLHRYDAAEHHYQQAMAADPRYFWAAADLALLYASASHEPHARRRLEELVDHLRRAFPDHHELPRTLERIEARRVRAVTSFPKDASDDIEH